MAILELYKVIRFRKIYFHGFLIAGFVLLNVTLSYSQNYIVESYRDVIPDKYYQKCIKSETLIKEAADSIQQLKIYYQLGRTSLAQNEDLNIEYCRQVLSYAKALAQDSIYNRGLIMASIAHINRAEFELCDPMLEEAIEYWTKENHSANLAHALKIYGYSLRVNGNYVKALDNHLRSYRLQKTYDETYRMGDIYNRLGLTYIDIGDHQAALNFYEEYFDVNSKEREYKRWLPTMMTNAANCYRAIGNDSLYYTYYRKSSKVYLASSSYKSKRRAYIMKSVIAQEENRLDSSLIFLDSALHYSKLFGSAHLTGYAHIDKYEVLRDLGKPDLARKELIAAKRIASNTNHLKLKKQTYKGLAEFYSDNRNYKEALLFQKKSDSINKIMFSKDIAAEIRKLGVSYQEEESQKEITLLKEQNRLKQENIEKESKIKKFLVGLAIATSVVLALVVLLLRQRTKTANSLQSKNEIITKSLKINENLLKEVHHRVKNNLQVVSSLLFLQSRYIKDPAAQEALQNGRDRVQAMSLLHQKLYQNEDVKNVSIRSYFKELSSSLFDTHKMDNQNVELETNISDIDLNVDIVIPMGLLVNELISNALKHAFVGRAKGVISLDILIQDNGHIRMTVFDDGIGIPFKELNESNNSLGMKLISSFAQKLKADVKIENEGGTRIQLDFDPEIVEGQSV